MSTKIDSQITTLNSQEDSRGKEAFSQREKTSSQEEEIYPEDSLNLIYQILSIFTSADFIITVNLDFMDIYNLSMCCKQFVGKFYYNDLRYITEIDSYIIKHDVRTSPIWTTLLSKTQKIASMKEKYYDYESCIEKYFYSTFNFCNYDSRDVGYLIAHICKGLLQENILEPLLKHLSFMNENRDKRDNVFVKPNKEDEVRSKLKYIGIEYMYVYPLCGDISVLFPDLFNKFPYLKPTDGTYLNVLSLVRILFSILDKYYSKLKLFKTHIQKSFVGYVSPSKINNGDNESPPEDNRIAQYEYTIKDNSLGVNNEFQAEKYGLHQGILNFLITNSKDNYKYDMSLLSTSVSSINSLIYILYCFIYEDESLTEFNKIDSCDRSIRSRILTFYNKNTKISIARMKYLTIKRDFRNLYHEHHFVKYTDDILEVLNPFYIIEIFKLFRSDSCAFFKEVTMKLLKYCLVNRSKYGSFYRKSSGENMMISFDDFGNADELDVISIIQYMIKEFKICVKESVYEFIITSYLLDNSTIEENSLTDTLLFYLVTGRKKCFLVNKPKRYYDDEYDDDSESDDEYRDFLQSERKEDVEDISEDIPENIQNKPIKDINMEELKLKAEFLLTEVYSEYKYLDQQKLISDIMKVVTKYKK